MWKAKTLGEVVAERDFVLERKGRRPAKNYVLGEASEGLVEAPAEFSPARRRARRSC